MYMQISTILSVLLVFLIPVAVGDTRYINENETVAVKSVEPCYLYGDSDLYGLGVRLSFYLQYLAAVICVGFQRSSELKSLRLGYNILSFTILVSLYRSAHKGSFALMEWYIIILLILLVQIVVIPVPLKIRYVILGIKTPARNEEQHARNEEHPQRDLEGQTDRGDADSKPRVKWILDLNFRPLLEDPMGVAFLLIVYCMYVLSLPWLYFTIVNSGHKGGCMALVLPLFKPVDVYNKIWLGYLRASSRIITVIVIPVLLPVAVLLVVAGVMLHKEIEEILEDMKKEEEEGITGALENPEQKTDDGGNSENQLDQTQPQGDAPHGGATNQGGPHPTDGVGNAERRLAELDDIEERHKLLQLLSKRQRKNNRWLHVGYAMIYVVLGGMAFYMVEGTIIVNHIQLDPISSNTGQLLALGVGVVSVVVTGYQAATKNYFNNRELKQKVLKSSFVGDLKIAESRTRAKRVFLSVRLQTYLQDYLGHPQSQTSGQGGEDQQSPPTH